MTTRTELEGDSDFFSSLLGEEAERRQRRVSGAVLIWDNRETQTVDLEKVEAQLFELVSGSRRAEVVSLNQDLAVRSTSIFRDFDADFLGPLFYWLPPPRTPVARSIAAGQIPRRSARRYSDTH